MQEPSQIEDSCSAHNRVKGQKDFSGLILPGIIALFRWILPDSMKEEKIKTPQWILILT